MSEDMVRRHRLMVNEKILKEIPGIIETFFIVLAIFLLFITFKVPVNPDSSVKLTYSRNFCSIIGWLMIGLFCHYWIIIHSEKGYTKKTMKQYTIITLVTSIVCILKVFISAANLLFYVNYPNKLILTYYIGETLAWVALAVFFICYAIKRITTDKAFKDHHHSHSAHYVRNGDSHHSSESHSDRDYSDYDDQEYHHHHHHHHHHSEDD